MITRALFLVSLSLTSLFYHVEATIDETLRFARGHQEFKNLYFKQHEQEFIRLIKEGQSPHALFIGCSDSGIVPDLILGTSPGELFVIRTAGNFVPGYFASLSGDGVGATIQYALEELDTKHIIVCGHSHCRAIQGLFKNLDNQKFGILKKWLRFGEEAKQLTLRTIKPRTPEAEIYQVAEHVSVIYQLEHLMSFPFVKQRVENGTLTLHGWHYKIETGEIEYYDFNSYSFKPLRGLLSAQEAPVEVEAGESKQ